MTIFPELPDSASVRVFCAARPLADADRAHVRSAMDAFLRTWMSHEMKVDGRWTLHADRFVVVAVDESKTHLSGCSKDSIVRAMRGLEAALGTTFVGTPPVVYRRGAEIICATRDEFGAAAARGETTPETIVFDMTVQTLGDLRAGRFECAAKNSWHARAFDFAEKS